MAKNQINKSDPNITLPFYPSSSWELKAANVISDNTKISANALPFFNYIQAFFGAGVTNATLAIFSGNYFDDETPIVSPVRFAFSGERVNFKGQLILASGKDILGNTITTTAIGSGITNVYAYGGTL